MERILDRINHFVGLLAVVALIGLTVFFCHTEITDLDLWLHLKAGEFITQSGYVPRVDVFSSTFSGKPWVNHEWLFQVLIYQAHSHFGFDGLNLLQALVVCLTLILLLMFADIHGKQLSTVCLILALVMIYRGRFTVRPDLFSIFFFSLYLVLLSSFLDRKWLAPVVFAVQALWVNMHGFFIFGPLMIGLAICCEYLKRRLRLPWEWNAVGRLSDDEYRRLKILGLVSLAACFVSPLGLSGALYPLKVLFGLAGQNRIFFQYIQELAPSLRWDTLISTDNIHYKILIWISIYSFVVNRKRIDLSALLLWAVFLVFSLKAVRNIIFFSVVAFFVIWANLNAYTMEDLLPVVFKKKRLRTLTIILMKAFLIFWMVDLGNSFSQEGYYDFVKEEMKSKYQGVALRQYPSSAADFILKAGIRGNILNDFNSGAYLIGRCYPQIKVFIDGRTELHGAKFFMDYGEMFREPKAETFDEAVKKYHLTVIFINNISAQISKKFKKFIWGRKDWVAVYLDYDGIVLLKDVPENQDVIAAYRLDKKGFHFHDSSVRAIGVIRVSPFREVKRAQLLEELGYDIPALDEAEKALRISPGHAEPYLVRGRIFWRQKKYQEAFEDFRRASMIAQGNSDARYNLALAYQRIGDLDRGIKELETILKANPQSAKVLYALSYFHALKDEDEKAQDLLRQALKDEVSTSKALRIARVFFKNKKYDLAIGTCSLLLAKNPRAAKAYGLIGRCFKAQRDLARALEACRRGLRLKPKDAYLEKCLEDVQRED